jgi:hypothetical protein
MRLFLLVFLTLCYVSSAAQQTGFHRVQKIFEAGRDGYYTYRIASMVSTARGSLIAFCAARKGTGGGLGSDRYRHAPQRRRWTELGTHARARAWWSETQR